MSAVANSSHEVKVDFLGGNVSVGRTGTKIMFESTSSESLQHAIDKLDFVAKQLAANVLVLRERHG